MNTIEKIGIALAFATAAVGSVVHYGAGYAQAKLAPEATNEHLLFLQGDCAQGAIQTCLMVEGIKLARN